MYPMIGRQLTIARKKSLTGVANMPSLTEKLPILTKKDGNTRSILFNRPHQLNAMNTLMIEYMSLYLKEWENSDDINMIFLKGQGSVFSSGADIKAMVEMIEKPSRREKLEYFIDTFYNTLHFMGEMKIPIISFMDGITMGGACGFSILSNFKIATENTKVAMPENRFGHFCDAASNFYLPRLNRNLGKYMALTATVLKAEDVLLSGLATHFVPSNKLDVVYESLVNLYRPSEDIIDKTIKQFAISPDDIPTSNILRYDNMNIIERCFQFDTIAEIFESLEKEGSKFALETMDQISLLSPISLTLTLEQLRRGSILSLVQSLQMERRSWRVSPYQPDFYEGVTSTLIKKKKPQWSRTSYLDVDFKKDIVEKYFDTEKEN